MLIEHHSIFFSAASYVSYWQWRHQVPRDHGGWPSQTWRTYGPKARSGWQINTMPDVCRKHDRMSWTFWSHWAGQASVSCGFHNKNSEDSQMRLFLLLQASHGSGNFFFFLCQIFFKICNELRKAQRNDTEWHGREYSCGYNICKSLIFRSQCWNIHHHLKYC